jgi:hypothetical protein
MRGRISKREIEAVQAVVRKSDKPVYLWDMGLKGFGARLAPSGTVSFVFEYRLGGRKGRTEGWQWACCPTSRCDFAIAVKAEITSSLNVKLEPVAGPLRAWLLFSQFSLLWIRRDGGELRLISDAARKSTSGAIQTLDLLRRRGLFASGVERRMPLCDAWLCGHAPL